MNANHFITMNTKGNGVQVDSKLNLIQFYLILAWGPSFA